MRYELVVIGTSWGGLHALSSLLGGLPADFRLPLVVVQHRSKDSDDTLQIVLQQRTPLPVVEAEDKEGIRPGRVYIAPPDYHLLVERGCFALSTEAPVAYSRPSIDVAFETAAEAYRERLVGVVMTGSNEDGSKGLGRIKAYGGYAVVQDPDSAESPVMPKAAVEAVAVDEIVPLEGISATLMRLSRA